ncbi:hypothetical protein BJ742DRAFT_777576 [Cladochytrium replicatum]|nr:hypothetical protein BJ742DRAFT_777576 [Cladochytrium replicatum]
MTFITVKVGAKKRFGANEERIFNSNCICIVLLNHIKRHPQVVAALTKTGVLTSPAPPGVPVIMGGGSCTVEDLVVDLASEGGEVMDLLNKPKEYARKFLEARGTYILVRVMADDSEDSGQQYVSLLEQAVDKVKFSVSSRNANAKSKRGHGGTANVGSDRLAASTNPSGTAGLGGGLLGAAEDFYGGGAREARLSIVGFGGPGGTGGADGAGGGLAGDRKRGKSKGDVLKAQQPRDSKGLSNSMGNMEGKPSVVGKKSVVVPPKK